VSGNGSISSQPECGAAGKEGVLGINVAHEEFLRVPGSLVLKDYDLVTFKELVCFVPWQEELEMGGVPAHVFLQ
jgi:hypothetical protein